jgi:hypothetical protein
LPQVPEGTVVQKQPSLQPSRLFVSSFKKNGSKKKKKTKKKKKKNMEVVTEHMARPSRLS